MFAPAHHLDPLRVLHGVRDDRYDCPDVPTLDRHITRLRLRMTAAASRSSNVVDLCRADIDRLLDRRVWLTWPVAVGLVAR